MHLSLCFWLLLSHSRCLSHQRWWVAWFFLIWLPPSLLFSLLPLRTGFLKTKSRKASVCSLSGAHFTPEIRNQEALVWAGESPLLGMEGGEMFYFKILSQYICFLIPTTRSGIKPAFLHPAVFFEMPGESLLIKGPVSLRAFTSLRQTRPGCPLWWTQNQLIWVLNYLCLQNPFTFAI